MKRLFLLLTLVTAAATANAFDFPRDTPTSSAIAASGTIQLAFSPEDDTGTLVVQAIHGARKQVLVQTFSFTHRKIAQALIEAKRRGIDVQLIADEEQIRRMQRGLVPEIAAAGVPTFVDREHDSAHNKIMVIDAGLPQAAVITGSFNFTHAAQYRNAENLLIFRGNPQLTLAYLKNWQHHRSHSKTFETHRF
ncbi:MAG: phospholipase D family protein [Sulfurimicrobium sp.]|jgi:phosphatidylserine/phosphatidylglycerophosphate/cardiolipin synthase-like enzyme|nr:phospholipase D family protein [Sulfurimicrobium sp.]MDO9189191.1 phospholipase D family protein [Sulfurimicrobium sp.]MDP1705864.1 phospholipase D family protein [Sulfurimicrobium sp.]MDP2200096.1 phospholipase D family protein [Sulfurimicrobium sp.]MDP2963809.1 phospholipase D family protein [Sulfurimicrobium sp.]